MDKKAPKVFHSENNKTKLTFKKKEEKEKKRRGKNKKQKLRTLSIVIVVDCLHIAYSLCRIYIAFTCTALANYGHT